MPAARRRGPRRPSLFVWVLLGAAALLGPAAVTVAVLYLAARPAAHAPNNDPPPFAAVPPAAPKAAPKGPRPPARPADGPIAEDVLAAVRAATVYVRVTLPDATTASGSGFFERRSGLVVTNAHVVGMLDPDAPPPARVEIVVEGGAGPGRERAVRAAVAGVDRDADLALLRPDSGALPAADRPIGLTVGPAKTLRLTQRLYALGYPFGERLGKEVTATETTVSSLRAGPDGGLEAVQVAGGINPGNSGGPVVDARGQVVGIAVSAVRGAQIQFAVPAERLDDLLAGRPGPPRFGAPVPRAAEMAVPVTVPVVDPLGNLHGVAVDWWFAPPGPAPARGEGPPAGGPARARAELAYDPARGLAAGEVLVGRAPEGSVLWVQAVLQGADGERGYGASATLALPPPASAVKARLAFQPRPLTSPVNLTLKTDLRLRGDTGDGQVRRTTLQAELEEDVGAADGTGVPVRWRLRYVEEETAGEDGPFAAGPRARSAGAFPVGQALSARVDARGQAGAVTVQAGGADAEARGYAERLVATLLALSVPLPDGDTKAGDTWKATRTLPLDLPGGSYEGALDLTYAYEGTRPFGSHRCAVVRVLGDLRGARTRGVQLQGTCRGMALVSTHSGRVLRARLAADVTLDAQAGDRQIHARGTTEAALARANDLGAQTGPPPEEVARNHLLGRWDLVRREQDGADLPLPGLATTLVVEDGRYYFVRGTRVESRVWYRLDPGGRPGTLDALTFEPDGTRGLVPGIYRVAGDSLLLCQNGRNGARPTGYVTAAGSGLTTYEYRRQPPDDRVLAVLQPVPKTAPKDSFEDDPARVLPVDAPGARPLAAAEAAGANEIAFERQPQRATRLKVCPDGSRLLATIDRALVVWDVSGKVLHRLQEGDNGGVVDFSVSADGMTCVTLRTDGTACVWDLTAGTKVRAWSVPGGALSVALSPGGALVAVGCRDKAVRVYQAADGAPVRRAGGQDGEVRCLAYSPTGTALAVSCRDVRLLDAATLKPLLPKPLPGSNTPSVAFTPDGATVLVNGRSCRLYRVADGTLVRELPGPGDPIADASLSGDGRLAIGFVPAFGKATILVWDVATGAETYRTTISQELNGMAVALSARGRWLFYAPAGGVIFRRDLPADAPPPKAPPPKGAAGRPATELADVVKFDALPAHPFLVRFSPDGRRVLLGRQNDFALWDAGTGKRVHQFKWDPMSASQAAFSREGDAEVIYAAGGAYAERTDKPVDFRVHVLDPGSGKVLHEVDGPPAPATALAVSPDGRRLLIGAQDRTVRFWQVDGLKETASVRAPQIPRCAAFSPDGKLALVVPITVGRIHFYDPEAGREVRATDRANVVEAAFLPGGKQVLSVGSDGLMRVWDADRGTEVRKWGSDGQATGHLTVSTDGKRALAAGAGGTMRVWDMEAGTVLAEMSHPKGFGVVALSPDGTKILTATSDGVRLVAVPK